MLEATLMATARFCLSSLQHPVGFFSKGKGTTPTPYKDLQAVKLGDASVLEVPWGGLHCQSTQFNRCQNVPTLSFELKPAVPSSPIYNPIFLDAQDGCPDSALFSIGIAEQYERHEKMLQFLRSGTSILDRGDLDFYVPSDLIGLHMLPIDVNYLHYDISNSFQRFKSGDDSHASFVYPQKELCSLNTFSDYVHELSFDPFTLVHANDHVLFPGTEIEMKALLAMITNIYLAKKAANQIQRREMVVPYFRRSTRSARGTQGHLKNVAAPANRLEEIKPRSMPKKKRSKKFGSEKVISRNSYSHACESFLSVILFRNPDKTAFIPLKRNGHELFQLLTQFSAGITGLGLAVLFSVILKHGNGRVPLCTTRVLSTGLALGLFWLSSSINALRDTIMETTKGLSNMKLKEDEIANKLERRAKVVFVRVAAVVAVGILQLA